MLWRKSSMVPAQVKMKYPFKEIACISATKGKPSSAISGKDTSEDGVVTRGFVPKMTISKKRIVSIAFTEIIAAANPYIRTTRARFLLNQERNQYARSQVKIAEIGRA